MIKKLWITTVGFMPLIWWPPCMNMQHFRQAMVTELSWKDPGTWIYWPGRINLPLLWRWMNWQPNATQLKYTKRFNLMNGNWSVVLDTAKYLKSKGVIWFRFLTATIKIQVGKKIKSSNLNFILRWRKNLNWEGLFQMRFTWALLSMKIEAYDNFELLIFQTRIT